MKLEHLEKWVSIFANLGVVAGIVFLALEIRTNTESNVIGIQEAFAGNYVQINSTMASPEMSGLFYRALNGEEIVAEERMQLVFIIRLYFSQANLMRRLYDRGLASEDELREAFTALRGMTSQSETIRNTIYEMTQSGISPNGRLVLDENGIEDYIRNLN